MVDREHWEQKKRNLARGTEGFKRNSASSIPREKQAGRGRRFGDSGISEESWEGEGTRAGRGGSGVGNLRHVEKC